ncbi:MAG: hypothetical protein AMXMBFR84_28340 [Candidatus Hydrogenedentota bacterium]
MIQSTCILLILVSAQAVSPEDARLLFPLDPLHNHAPSIAQLPDGEMLAAWYRGSGESEANDACIMGSRLSPESGAWSDPFVLADTPNLPDLNPVLFSDSRQRLWLFYTTYENNNIDGCRIKYHVADSTEGAGPPEWIRSEELQVRPDAFNSAYADLQSEIAKVRANDLAESESLRQITERQVRMSNTALGWVTRSAPLQLTGGRIVLGLYHDVFACSLVAATDDAGVSWQFSAPIQSVYLGCVQPALAERRGGTLVAFLRDNGKPKQLRKAVSTDKGLTWSRAMSTDMPNPGSSVAHLRLRSGAWLLLCNDLREGRTRLTAYLSDDEGESWPMRRVVDQLDEGEVHYPSAVESNDGAIHMVYTYSLPPTLPGERNESIKYFKFDEHWVRQGATGRVLAFPGAEGYGRFAKGGRGGDVYHVTTLDDDGPGSLRHGLASANGPRTIVFDTGGTIALKSPIRIESQSHITIAGQTAPGDGITIRDHGFILKNASHIIMRYFRMRLGDENKSDEGPDVLSTDDVDNIILDHLSMSWGIDGIHDTRRYWNYTIQWCILSEALHDSIHPKGPHAMCASFRAPIGNVSIHHNLFSTSRDRHPTIGGSVVEPQWTIDFRNNVIYNWRGAANVCDNQVSLIGNVFRPGPETAKDELPIAMKTNFPNLGRGYMSGNRFDGREDLNGNDYAAVDMHRWIDNPDSEYVFEGTIDTWRLSEAIDFGNNTPSTHSADEAYTRVLSSAGASRVRDAVDLRVMKDVENQTGALLNSQNEVGGWPMLNPGAPSPDADGDGMPDSWEARQGLDPRNPDDRNGDLDGDEWTNLEEFLAEQCES